MDDDLTRLRLAYVHRFKDRHGKVRHYFRRPGHVRAALPGLPGSAEFMAAYQTALAGDTAPKLPIGADRTLPGSFSALAAAYYGSAEWSQLAPITQATYRNLIESLRVRAARLPVATMPRAFIQQEMDRKRDTPAAANATLKMLRILMRFAVDRGWRADDPTANIRRVVSKSDGIATWSEDDIAAFEARWPIDSRERLALALLLYTGQRKGDMVRMGPQHLHDGRIAVRQQKTGERLSIPVHPNLTAALAAHPSGHLAFLTTRAGSPFTSAGFGNWFADAVKAAGLVGRSAHGLRKAQARRLAEAGCSAKQIAAITGHRSLREVERYTRAADQEILADSAMARLVS